VVLSVGRGPKRCHQEPADEPPNSAGQRWRGESDVKGTGRRRQWRSSDHKVAVTAVPPPRWGEGQNASTTSPPSLLQQRPCVASLRCGRDGDAGQGRARRRKPSGARSIQALVHHHSSTRGDRRKETPHTTAMRDPANAPAGGGGPGCCAGHPAQNDLAHQSPPEGPQPCPQAAAAAARGNAHEKEFRPTSTPRASQMRPRAAAAAARRAAREK